MLHCLPHLGTLTAAGYWVILVRLVRVSGGWARGMCGAGISVTAAGAGCVYGGAVLTYYSKDYLTALSYAGLT